MIIVKEEQFRKRTVYYRIIADEDGRELSMTRFDCRTFPYELYGRLYYYIGDRLNQIRFQPFDYVNRIRRGAVDISRRQAANALQLYYTFCDIYECDPEHLTTDGYQQLKDFLRGIDIEPMPGSTVTSRTTSTVKAYLGLIRAFLMKKRFDLSAFSDDTDLRGNSVGKLFAPRHMNPDQIQLVAEEIAKAKDETMMLVFHIGIVTGLRRGEILGLTLHDILAQPIPSVGKAVTSDIQYSLIIRNRPSDDKDRHGKMLRHPNEKQVNAAEFKRSFYEVPIDKNLYEHINWYIHQTRDVRNVGGEDVLRRINTVTKATGNDTEGGNHYIFYIKWRGDYRLLSGRTLNNRLKKYYDRAGVNLVNISHAMRHSFAMYLAHYSPEPVDLKKLQTALRHASQESTMRYFNLTDQEYRAISNEFSKSLTELIPAFKMDIYKNS